VWQILNQLEARASWIFCIQFEDFPRQGIIFMQCPGNEEGCARRGGSMDVLGMFWGCSGDVLGMFWGCSGDVLENGIARLGRRIGMN
jgi:hypothetical protein